MEVEPDLHVVCRRLARRRNVRNHRSDAVRSRTLRLCPVRAACIAAALTTSACGDGGLPEARALETGATLSGGLGPTEAPALPDYAVARDQYTRGIYDSADAAAVRGMAHGRRAGDDAETARWLTLRGLVAYRTGDLVLSRARHEEALELKRRSGATDELAASYNALGLVAWLQSRLDDALAYYDMALKTATPDDRAETETVVSINRGLVSVELAQFADARRYFERSIELAREAGDVRREAIAVTDAGMVRVWTGEPDAAVPILERGLELARIAEDPTVELNALGQLGTAYTALGQFDRAIASLTAAVEASRAWGLQIEEADNVVALSEVYRNLGDGRRAMDLLLQAETAYRAAESLGDLASTLRLRAEIATRLGDLGSAREDVARALEIHRASGALWEQLADLLLLADVSDQQGNAAAADRRLSEAQALAISMDAPTLRIEMALARARIADRRQEYRSGLESLSGVEADIVRTGPEAGWEASILRARALRALGDTPGAIAAGYQATGMVEAARASLGASGLGSALVTDRRDAYGILVATLLEAGRTGEAFDVADRAREQTVYGSARAADAGNAEAAVRRQDVLRRIHRLGVTLREMERLPAEERRDAAPEDVRRRLAQALEEFERLSHDPSPAATTAAPSLDSPSSTLARVQRALVPGEVLIQYFVAGDGLVAMGVTVDRIVTSVRTVPEEQLARRVRVAREMVATPDWIEEAGLMALAGLHDLLLSDLRAELGAFDRTYVVPHRALVYVPFAALWDAASGTYLTEETTLTVLPSAAAFVELRDRGSPSSLPVATVQAFAPLPNALPASAHEAERVHDALGTGRPTLGASATEAALRDALSEPGTVHVATHGVLDPRSPFASHLRMSPGLGGEADDGRLEAHEVFDLDVRSSLVFLSGCETGSGLSWSTEFAAGEDFAALSRAFLFAGAESVVSTLWAIEDKGAAELAARFYKAYAVSNDPAQALSQAQRDLLRSERYRPPFYWSGHQIAGAAHGRRDGLSRKSGETGPLHVPRVETGPPDGSP